MFSNESNLHQRQRVPRGSNKLLIFSKVQKKPIYTLFYFIFLMPSWIFRFISVTLNSKDQRLQVSAVCWLAGEFFCTSVYVWWAPGFERTSAWKVFERLPSRACQRRPGNGPTSAQMSVNNLYSKDSSKWFSMIYPWHLLVIIFQPHFRLVSVLFSSFFFL